MVKAIEVSATALGLFGVAVGAYGTYLLTKWYQPFRFWGLLGALGEILWKLITGRKQQAIEKIEIAADFAAFLNQENKATSLFGIYLVLIGFGIQVLSAIFATAVALLRPS